MKKGRTERVSDDDKPTPPGPEKRVKTEAMPPVDAELEGAIRDGLKQHSAVEISEDKPPLSSFEKTKEWAAEPPPRHWNGNPEVDINPAEADDKSRFPIPTPATVAGASSSVKPPPRPLPSTTATRWWQRPRPGALAMDPASRLTHHLGYETAQAIVVAGMLGVLAFVALGGQFADLYIKLRGSAPSSGDVTLLTIGDEALYLWNPSEPLPDTTPRAMLAGFVRFLDEAGARVVVLDFLLDRPAPGDNELAAAAQGHGAVISAEQFVLTDHASGREFVPGTTPGLGNAIFGGLANFQQEQNRLFSSSAMLARRSPLVRRVARARLEGSWPGNMDGSEQTGAEIRPAMALAAAWLYRATETDPAARGDQLLRTLQDQCTGLPMRCEGGLEELGLPDGPGRLEDPLEINYRGPESGDGLPTVRGAHVMRLMSEAALLRGLGIDVPMVNEEMSALLEDRLVVVCRVDQAAAAHGDRFVTPYSFPLLRDADMSGGRIQAQLIDTLLTGRHVRHISGWLSLLLAIGVAVAVVYSRRLLRDDVHTVACLIAFVAMVLFGALLFRVTDGLVLGLGLPLVAGLLSLITVRVHSWSLE